MMGCFIFYTWCNKLSGAHSTHLMQEFPCCREGCPTHQNHSPNLMKEGEDVHIWTSVSKVYGRK